MKHETEQRLLDLFGWFWIAVGVAVILSTGVISFLNWFWR